MYEGIIKNIGLNLDINAKKRVEGDIDVKLYSKDIGTGVFEFTFLDENEQKIKIDNTYSSRVMLKTDYDDNVYVTNIEIAGGIARFVFPHKFITQSGTVTLYLYLTKNDKTSDVASISFNVYRSEIDDVATDIITTYDKNYEDILADFEEYINISKEEWKGLIDETRDFVAEIEDLTIEEFITLKMDEKYNNIEQNYATRLVENEQNIASTNAQLAQTVDDVNSVASEIILARGDFNVLGDRLDNIDTELSRLPNIYSASGLNLGSNAPHTISGEIVYTDTLAHVNIKITVTGEATNIIGLAVTRMPNYLIPKNSHLQKLNAYAKKLKTPTKLYVNVADYGFEIILDNNVSGFLSSAELQNGSEIFINGTYFIG